MLFLFAGFSPFIAHVSTTHKSGRKVFVSSFISNLQLNYGGSLTTYSELIHLFKINSESLGITGLCRHQVSPWNGVAGCQDQCSSPQPPEPCGRRGSTRTMLDGLGAAPSGAVCPSR